MGLIRDTLSAILPSSRRDSRIEMLEQQHGQIDTKDSGAARAAHQDSNVYTNNYFGSGSGFGDLGMQGDEGYSTLLNKYARSVWLYIGVSTIAGALSQVNFRVIDKRRKGQPNEAVKGDGVGLSPLLNNPNPWMSAVEFKETVAMHLLLTGNAYIEKAALDSRGRPHELYVLNPKNMQVLPHPTKFVKGYVYTVNQIKISFSPDEVIHIKMPDPRGESHYGLAPIAAIRQTMDLDWEALNWNASYFSNATWPSGVITVEDGLNEEEYRRAKRELKQSYEGTSKVGKIIILSGGMNWQQTTPNPKDLDFLNLRKHSREEILSILKVPPSIVGIFNAESSSGRSAGVREQHIDFWSRTIQPLANRILTKLNSSLTKEFSQHFEIVPDITNIPALRETDDMKKVRAETAATLVERVGWPINKVLGHLYPDEAILDWGDIPSPRFASYSGTPALSEHTGEELPEAPVPVDNAPEDTEEPEEEDKPE